ncbi:MAG: substrate-binding domain-containing protein [Anaerolineae bacterium]|jgi:phosphate transport system substrate-binding protein|nr:substrate-binding domain-containing protein [Anaerolineae bacterium]
MKDASHALERRRACRPLPLVAVAVCVLLAACSRAEAPRPTPVAEHYRLIADSATQPLLQVLTDAYVETVNPYARFTIELGAPAHLAERLRSGRVLLGATSLVPPEPPGLKWWLADLALDGVAVIVHADNPINALALRDLRDIFSGVRNDWADYGEDELGNIEVAVREDGDGTRVTFDRIVMGDQRLTFDALVMPSVETTLNFVALRPGAIGYVPSPSVAGRRGTGAGAAPPVKALALDGVAPTAENLISGEYPLVRTLNLIGLYEPQGELRNFVAWALGPQGRAITESLGYAAFQ